MGKTQGAMCKTQGAMGKTQESKTISEDQIEPLKVYVGNLRASVTDIELRNVFSHYATVVNAFVVRDKHTHKSRGFGFVQVATPEDVQKLLSLRDGDKYIFGQRAVIQPAKKKSQFYLVIMITSESHYLIDCMIWKLRTHQHLVCTSWLMMSSSRYLNFCH